MDDKTEHLVEFERAGTEKYLRSELCKRDKLDKKADYMLQE